MLSWPRWRWITVSGTPAWIRQPALVCLRSWGLGLGAPRQPLPEQVNTQSPVRSSLARVAGSHVDRADAALGLR